MKIDLVVPYVDSSDAEWQKLFEQYTSNTNEEGIDAPNRFRGQGRFFRFFFRCVEKNLPWINNIFLLVQSESQVPDWIDRKTVHVVLHKDFIPEEYLPIFNSTAIEMFLWNIPGLSEKFLYANDDMFVTAPIAQSNFFRDDKVVINIFTVNRLNTVYYNQVDNSYKEIYKSLQKDVVTIGHTFRPYFKSDMYQCFREHEEHIRNSISRFRQPNNFNVYLFTYYLLRLGKVITSDEVSNITSDKVQTIIKSLNSGPKLNTCVQDTQNDINIYEDPDLIIAFRHLFSKVSKYENPYAVAGITPEQRRKIEALIQELPPENRATVKIAILKSWTI